MLSSATEPARLCEVRHFQRSTAGAVLNVSVGLARRGHTVGHVSKVGRDSFGDQVLNLLAAEGIDRSQVGIDDRHPTGFMLVADAARGPLRWRLEPHHPSRARGISIEVGRSGNSKPAAGHEPTAAKLV